MENIENKIADWLGYFSYNLDRERVQETLFDTILTIEDNYTDKEEAATIRCFLESSLKLVFLMKDNPEEFEKFIKYHYK